MAETLHPYARASRPDLLAPAEIPRILIPSSRAIEFVNVTLSVAYSAIAVQIQRYLWSERRETRTMPSTMFDAPPRNIPWTIIEALDST